MIDDTAIGKSRNTAEVYAGELKAKGLCSLVPSRVPYIGATFRIEEEYWPFQSDGCDSSIEIAVPYVDSVRTSFLALGCTTGRFGPSEQRQAQDFQQRNIPLSVLEDAMLVGACRKYVSWLNNGPSQPISSLAYFESLIEEVQERPFPSRYRDYLRLKVQKLSDLWNKSANKEPSPGGYPDMDSSEIAP
jgi:hypothetical protein